MGTLLTVATITLASIAAISGAAPITSIRQVDFQNFPYAWTEPVEEPASVPEPWTWLMAPTNSDFRVKNGIRHFHAADEDAAAPLISVHSVAFGDLDGDGIEEAAVALNYSAGGTANWDYIYIYKLVDGHVELLARMQAGSRAYGGLAAPPVMRNGELVVDFNDASRRTGECCSAGYIRVHYCWRDGKLIETGTRQRGDNKVGEQNWSEGPKHLPYNVLF
jgi:hypothetical protein